MIKQIAIGIFSFLMFQTHAYTQGKYLEDDKGLSFGVAGSISKTDNNFARSWALYGTNCKNMEMGISLPTVNVIFDNNDGTDGETKKINAISPYFEIFMRRDEKHPVSVSVSFSYLRYLKKDFKNHFLAVSASTFRDVNLNRGFSVIPEFGITKSIMTGSSKDEPLIFSLALGLSADLGVFSALITPQFSIQDGTTSSGLSLSFVFSPNQSSK
ncbi:hypothetical protein JNL27_10800 [bacterium]|nr:hypothetical protein [bacterium]